MRNSLTSRYKKKQVIKYYTDVNLETKLWEVIELPSRRVVQDFEFEEDASRICYHLNKHKPFGEYPMPAFLTVRG
tara:strand:+ start:228 stop:452 length:225 start_codon:yes stop_codon:yes gene_type:complete